jgi:hypothetical protein
VYEDVLARSLPMPGLKMPEPLSDDEEADDSGPPPTGVCEGSARGVVKQHEDMWPAPIVLWCLERTLTPPSLAHRVPACPVTQCHTQAQYYGGTARQLRLFKRLSAAFVRVGLLDESDSGPGNRPWLAHMPGHGLSVKDAVRAPRLLGGGGMGVVRALELRGLAGMLIQPARHAAHTRPHVPLTSPRSTPPGSPTLLR